MRCVGAAVIDSAWVAAGRTRAFIGFNERLHDLAATLLLLHEVGAIVGFPDGSPLEIEPLLTGNMIGRPWIILPPDCGAERLWTSAAGRSSAACGPATPSTTP
jgi:hypothetical protein